ncbi:TetR family transcriptional regulator [Virgisporangium aliadipatigenens]|uniref:TetR family transcriptional regulator n=1 Tax=Virgisporangium aliadipatigenens TaxID=741659 RepID=A0A8J4DMQ7_9ACTN|nr:TetR/AcrR family transcriptional regulator [Virgisporangium aliadipatigenens]GIJ43629.1 TetR family transcriptional regulator [Virgisporangium aliadipatigenens]
MERKTTKHDLRSAATRERLIAVARTLFAQRGYADVGTEEIVQTAGVTRGALYHQFRDKAELFTAVVEAVETRIVAEVTAALAEPTTDPVERLISGARAFLAACADPATERIVLRDAPAVLGAARWQELSERYGLGLVQQAVHTLLADGTFAPQPAAPLARLLLGALNEAARYVSAAEDPRAATEECLRIIGGMLDGLRTAPGADRR